MRVVIHRVIKENWAQDQLKTVKKKNVVLAKQNKTVRINRDAINHQAYREKRATQGILQKEINPRKQMEEDHKQMEEDHMNVLQRKMDHRMEIEGELLSKRLMRACLDV